MNEEKKTAVMVLMTDTLRQLSEELRLSPLEFCEALGAVYIIAIECLHECEGNTVTRTVQ